MKSGSFHACIIILLVPFLLLPIASPAQSHPILSDFSAIQDGPYLRIQWTIIAGATCNGTLIERAGEDLLFTKVGDIPGVCGDISSPLTYVFTDSFPLFNTLNHYRLELGFQGYTDTLIVEHSPLSGIGTLAFPNPFSTDVEIRFSNPGQEQARVEVYDQLGRLISTKLTETDRVLFSFPELEAGMYIYRLTVNNQWFVGRVMRIQNP